MKYCLLLLLILNSCAHDKLIINHPASVTYIEISGINTINDVKVVVTLKLDWDCSPNKNK